MAVRDALVELLLLLPGLVQQLSDGVHLPEQQRLLHLQGLLLEVVEGLDRRLVPLPVGLHLPLDDVRRLPRLPHVAEQQAVLELAQHVVADAQRVHQRRVPMELDQVEAPEGGGVLVLPPAREPQVDALDPERQLGRLVAGERTPEPLVDEADQRHHQRRRGAQPRARRGVHVHPHVGAAPHPERPHHRLDEVQVAVEAHAPRMVVLRHHVVVEARQRQPRIAARPERGERVLVDGGRQHHPSVLLGIGRDVGAAAAEREPERGAGAEVEPAHPPKCRCARSHSSGVPMSKNGPGKRNPRRLPEPASPGSTSSSSDEEPAGSRRHRAGEKA